MNVSLCTTCHCVADDEYSGRMCFWQMNLPMAHADARYEYAAPDALFHQDSHVWNKRFERVSGLSLNECSIVDPTGLTQQVSPNRFGNSIRTPL